MRVRELIEKLKTFPQDSMVVADGYEDGFDMVKKVSSIKIAENTRKEWYTGKYVESEDSNGIDAVLLFADTKADNK